MFFILSKLLSFALDPILWVIILFFLGFITKKKPLLIVALTLLMLLTSPYLNDLALRKWESKPVAKSDLPLSDIGIVLTGMTSSDMEPRDQLHFNESADRITEAIMLLDNGVIKKLIISGGTPSFAENSIAESIQLEQLLLASDVSPRDYHLETRSRNTYENAKYCAEYVLSEKLENQKILLITSAFHMPRALACFKKQGINVSAYPVDFKTSPSISISSFIPSSQPLDYWRLLIKEWIGYATYKMIGYI